MKTILYTGIIMVFATTVGSISVNAQRETEAGVAVERDLELARRDLQSEKKKIVAMNVPLTAEESTRFWPIYDQYTDEMRKVNDEFYNLIKDYVANQKVITDAQGISMIKRWGDIQARQIAVRQRFIPQFEKVIPGKKVAVFFQIDRRLYALMDLQISSQLPLISQ